MTKGYPSRDVRRVLRQLGLKELASGKGGHSVLVSTEGRQVSPPLRKKEMPFPHIFALAVILERLGVVASKRAFIAMIKNGVSNEQPKILAASAF